MSEPKVMEVMNSFGSG